MRKYIHICIPVLVLTAIISLYFTLTGESSLSQKWYAWTVQKIPETYAESVENTKKVAEADAVSINRAVEKHDIKICDQVQSTTKKGECRDMIYAEEALIAKDIEKCQSLSSADTIGICQDNISSERAQRDGDKTYCANIHGKNLQNYCEKEVDTKKLNLALERNTLSQEFCSSLVASLQKDCKRSLTRTDDTAVYATAIEKKDPNLCTTLTDEVFRNNCHDAVVLKLALADKNIDDCGGIFDSTKKAYCESILTIKSDARRFQEVVDAWDIAGCNSFHEKKIQYQCSDMITMALVRNTRDQNLCGNLFNTGMQFACMQIANATH